MDVPQKPGFTDKIYFENEEVREKVTTFMKMFSLEMMNLQGNILFREKGSNITLEELTKIASNKKG